MPKKAVEDLDFQPDTDEFGFEPAGDAFGFEPDPDSAAAGQGGGALGRSLTGKALSAVQAGARSPAVRTAVKTLLPAAAAFEPAFRAGTEPGPKKVEPALKPAEALSIKDLFPSTTEAFSGAAVRAGMSRPVTKGELIGRFALDVLNLPVGAANTLVQVFKKAAGADEPRGSYSDAVKRAFKGSPGITEHERVGDFIDSLASFGILDGVGKILNRAGKVATRKAQQDLARDLELSGRQAGIPSRESVSGEAAGALSTEEIAKSARTQPPSGPSHVSVQASSLPGGATTRATVPPTAAGGTITRITGPFTVGSIDPTSGKSVLQVTDDIQVLLKTAQEAKPVFDTQLSSIVARTPGARIINPPGLSGSRVKLLEKLERKVGPHRPAQTVSDFLGARVSVNTVDDADQVVRELQKIGKIVHDENFYQVPKAGYRSRHVQVELPNGLTAEVQLPVPEVAAVQEKAHALYDKFKHGTGSVKEITAAQVQVQSIFDDAWAKYVKRTNFEAQQTLRAQAGQFTARVSQTRDGLLKLNERAEIALAESETVAKTGTLAKETRVPFREAGPKPQTLATRFSEKDIIASQNEIFSIGRQWRKLKDQLEQVGDAASVNTAKVADDLMADVIRKANAAANEFRKLRFAAGRSVYRFNRPIPPDVIASLEEMGVLTENLTKAKVRLPIYTNIIRGIKEWKTLGPSDWRQFRADLVDAWRLNLFSATSWTLDLFGNAGELTAQLGGSIGRDIGHAVQGKLTFPSLRAYFRALRHPISTIKGSRLPAPAAEAVGAKIVSGEQIRGSGFGGAGTFTRRLTPGTAAVDYLVGSPLYAKGVTDKAARSFAATTHLWRSAQEEADRLALKGLARREFYRSFWSDPPEEALNAAIDAAKKAGFSRDLSRWENAIAGSTMYRLLGDVFARWPFQFSRAAAEWLGWNPQLARQFYAGEAKIEDIFEWLGKSATGLGGLYLINEGLYDRVDFNSMEYVHEDGNRSRLSNRDPIPTALWFLAFVKRDKARSTQSLRYASIPFARLMIGEGGLLGNLLKQYTVALDNAQIDPRAVKRQWESVLNRMIPGQALLAAVETLLDPTIRKGIGSNVPGVSAFRPPVIKPTTGEPLKPEQEVFGVKVPTIAGTAIPGAKRILDPIEQLLSKYGLLVYRAARTPIAGVPPADLSDEVLDEWTRRLGRYRQALLGELASSPVVRDVENLTYEEREIYRERIQDLDALAARFATRDIEVEYGAAKAPKLYRRKPTVKEQAGPKALEKVNPFKAGEELDFRPE